MRILAIETSLAGGSVALADGPAPIACQMLPLAGRVAQTLTPATAALLAAAGWRPGDVQLVAVAIGPGSFTGLRVGVTAAKAFAYAIGAEALGVSTLETIALAAVTRDVRPLVTIYPVIDAQRKQLFAGRYDCAAEGDLRLIGDERVVSIEQWLATLTENGFVTGPGLRLVEGRLPASVSRVGEERWLPSAALVAEIAWRDWQAGRRDSLWKLAPRYIRDSAAQEKANAKSDAR
jgi:tRNA threonylcarbamoyladenosine biosynthesis protein TsaB